jgi:hypothetical protein
MREIDEGKGKDLWKTEVRCQKAEVKKGSRNQRGGLKNRAVFCVRK